MGPAREEAIRPFTPPRGQHTPWKLPSGSYDEARALLACFVMSAAYVTSLTVAEIFLMAKDVCTSTVRMLTVGCQNGLLCAATVIPSRMPRG